MLFPLSTVSTIFKVLVVLTIVLVMGDAYTGTFELPCTYTMCKETTGAWKYLKVSGTEMQAKANDTIFVICWYSLKNLFAPIPKQ
jgi:hypothetical protein